MAFPRSSGGLLVADDTWLLTRDEVTGRRGCRSRLAGIALAAALVAEQFLVRTVDLDGDRIVFPEPGSPPPARPGFRTAPVAASASPKWPLPPLDARFAASPEGMAVRAAREDELVCTVYRRMRLSGDVSGLAAWVEVLADEAEGLVGERLAASHPTVVDRVTGPGTRLRRWLGGDRYRLLDTNATASTAQRLQVLLTRRRQHPSVQEVLLCGLLRAAHLDTMVFLDLPTDYAEFLTVLCEHRLPPWAQQLVAETEVLASAGVYRT